MTLAKRAAIIAFGAYIVASPALPQVFGVAKQYVRYWTMYGDVGAGTLKGVFTATAADGRQVDYTPLEVLGAERYPNTFHYEFNRRVLSYDDLRRFAADFCRSRAEDIVQLDYAGLVGLNEGWVDLEMIDICADARPEIFADA